MCSELGLVKLVEKSLPVSLQRPVILGGLSIGGGLIGIAGVRYIRGKYTDWKIRNEFDSRRKERQEARAKKFRYLEEKYKLGAKENEIVQLPYEELVSRLQSRKLTCRQVLEAFVSKSIQVTNEFNCITEFMPNMFEKADELDALPSVKGPLHGIPICVKDDHDQAGMDSSMGYAKNLNKPAAETSTVVQVLEDAGAIPFCRTNLPQGCFSFGSDNPIYGTTVNPLNKLLGPGGSSSGTACLVGAGGAAFGFGSDTGGSVRIPAHFCGIATLRPTVGRTSDRGVGQVLKLNAAILGVSGVLAPRVSTLAHVFETMTKEATQNKYDPLVPPIPWDSSIFNSKEPLRIGYYTSINYFPALGDTPKTVLDAKAALESMGHTLVPFELPDPYHIMEVTSSLYGADGGNQMYNNLRNDKVSYTTEKFLHGKTLVSSAQLKINSILKCISCSSSKGTKSRSMQGDPAVQKSETLWDYLALQREIKYEVIRRMKDLKLDLILSPAFPFPATRVHDTELLNPSVVYTCTWNLVDFPAGIVPFGKESCTKIDSFDDENDPMLKVAKEGIRFAKDMPIGVQIIGKPFQEEMVLRVLKQLDEFKLAHK